MGGGDLQRDVMSRLADPEVPPVTAPASSYPDVPVLIFSGALDLRSPTLEARAALAQLPQGKLVVVTNTGHSALTTATSPCVASAVKSWLRGQTVPSICRARRLINPLAALPRSGRTHAAQVSSPRALLPLVSETIHEAEATWLLCAYNGMGRTVPGLDGGKLDATATGFGLSGYSLSDGVGLSGQLRYQISANQPLRFEGVVRVTDRAGAVGTLVVNGDALDGTLDATPIAGSQIGHTKRGARPSGKAASSWSPWTPPTGSTATVTSSIAAHVAGTYEATPNGAQRLVTISSRAARSTGPGGEQPVLAIADRGKPYGHLNFRDTTNTWIFKLCGRASECSIIGQPSGTREQLIRREALQLALYTFKFEPQIDSVVVYLPPPPHAGPVSTLLYFHRDALTREISRPLDRTLVLAAPPLPNLADRPERQTIDRLTLPRLFTFSTARSTTAARSLCSTPPTNPRSTLRPGWRLRLCRA